ncbi:hypothetical protein HID58_067625 [Brassica napus]|uniref:Uncharacterized protein n=4 Tax=Brassica TaxID=3705 RepID=A0ABQ7ZJ28_BRANA|nr:hypothetical protein HID58_067625 [Brassica napus]
MTLTNLHTSASCAVKMSLLCYSSCVAPPFPQTKLSTPSFLKPKTRTLTLCSAIGYPNSITGIKKDISYLFTGPHKLPSLAKSQILVSPESFTANSTIDIDWEDQEDVEDTGSPWEGSSAGWMSTLFKDSQGRGWHSKALKDGKSDSHRVNFSYSLEDNRQDHELSLSANKPSFILFVDRSSGSLEDRRKSMKALCTFRGRLENLEVMSKHGPELWRQNNHRLEVFLTRMQKLAHGQNEEIEKVNRERKYHQQTTAYELNALSQEWRQLCVKKMEIQSA